MLHFYLQEKYCTVLWKQLKYRNVVKVVALMLLSILSNADGSSTCVGVWAFHAVFEFWKIKPHK